MGKNNSKNKKMILNNERNALIPIGIDWFKKKIETTINLKKIPTILLSTGSYCPIHEGHLEMFVETKNFLEKEIKSFEVICALISPSNDEYVMSKAKRNNFEFKEHFIDFKTRCNIIENLIEKKKLDDFVFIDKWEGKQAKFIDFPQVWSYTQYCYDKLLQEMKINTPIKVFYIVGSDMILRTGIHKIFRNLTWYGYKLDLNLMVLERDTDEIDIKNLQDYRNLDYESMVKKHLFYKKMNPKCYSLSSTKVRNEMKKT